FLDCFVALILAMTEQESQWIQPIPSLQAKRSNPVLGLCRGSLTYTAKAFSVLSDGSFLKYCFAINSRNCPTRIYRAVFCNAMREIRTDGDNGVGT
ncbi:MAG: hypothetical protein FWF12_07860, partial [Betaproteobacteria bacterium]|nr:hypothetical protein [Betaproteobacteria bacterium]